MQILNTSSNFNEMSPSEPVISVSNLNHYFGKGGLRKQLLCLQSKRKRYTWLSGFKAKGRQEKGQISY
jgi:hypothetical protein